MSRLMHGLMEAAREKVPLWQREVPVRGAANLPTTLIAFEQMQRRYTRNILHWNLRISPREEGDRFSQEVNAQSQGWKPVSFGRFSGTNTHVTGITALPQKAFQEEFESQESLAYHRIHEIDVFHEIELGRGIAKKGLGMFDARYVTVVSERTDKAAVFPTLVKILDELRIARVGRDTVAPELTAYVTVSTHQESFMIRSRGGGYGSPITPIQGGYDPVSRTVRITYAGVINTNEHSSCQFEKVHAVMGNALQVPIRSV